MSYTKLESYQFERGKGFTEESVLAFRSLAFAAIDELVRSQQKPMSSNFSHEASAPLSADPPARAEVPDAATDLGSPPDDDFAAAARWLALATRNETEPYQPSLVRQRG
jgi:hypothetical protein